MDAAGRRARRAALLFDRFKQAVREADRPNVVFIATWKENLDQMRNYHKDIQDMVVEMDTERPGVARVWVYSRITGIPGAAVTDSIDMMHFSADGLFIDSKDVQRAAAAS